MQKTRFASILAIVVIILVFVTNIVFAVSATKKSEDDYKLILYNLRSIRITIDNFGTDKQKEQYSKIQGLFQKATEEYYAQNFFSSQDKYYKTKENLIQLLKDVSDLYISRAREILDSTSKKAVDILIKYDKNTAFAKYFRKPYNPIEDIKAYDEKEYHLFHDKKRIESYLRNGYKKLEIAKNLLADSDFKIIFEKEKKTSENLEYILKQYFSVISSCKFAKSYGIEIYKVININQIGEILDKYDIGLKELIPIYDDRIPEEYKIDANDNSGLVHSFEQKKLSNKK